MSPSAYLLLALTATAAPLPEAPPVIRWKLEKGMTFYQEMTTETHQQMKISGADVTQKQRQTFCYRWDVLRPEGAGWVLRQRIEGLKLEIDIGGNKIAYDSTRPDEANNPLAEFFKSLTGADLILTLDRDLRVSKVGGGDELANKLAAANPDMRPLMTRMLSEAAMKEMAGPLFSALPPRAVEKGESWAHVARLDMGPVGRYGVTYEYMFEGRDVGQARFKVDNVGFKYEPPANGGEGLPFVLKRADLKSKKGTGHIVFDLNKGRMDRAEMQMEIEGPLEISIGGQDTTVELRQTQKTTTRVTDENPLKK